MGGFKAKYLSTSEHYDQFIVFKSDYTNLDVLSETENTMRDPIYRLPIVPLEDVPSQNEGNRKAYLLKNICKRYYPNDQSFTEKYFGNGDH